MTGCDSYDSAAKIEWRSWWWKELISNHLGCRGVRVMLLTTPSSDEIEFLRVSGIAKRDIVCAEIDHSKAKRLRQLGLVVYGGDASELFMSWNERPFDIVALDTCSNFGVRVCRLVACLLKFRAASVPFITLGINMQAGREQPKDFAYMQRHKLSTRPLAVLNSVMNYLQRCGQLAGEGREFLPGPISWMKYRHNKVPMHSMVLKVNTSMLQYRSKSLYSPKLAAAKAIATRLGS